MGASVAQKMSLAIIGAGPGGLVALKEALETKFFTSVTVLEKKDTVGGQWSRDISVYPDLRLNTSRLLSGYPKLFDKSL